MRFDPAHPEPDWSLNRVRLMDLPGICLPDNMDALQDFRGRSAYELVSAAALDQQLHDVAFMPHLPPAERRQAFFAALESGKSQQAAAIARRIGAGLGLLLLTLKRGDAVNRAARPEWDHAIWDYWSRVERVILGGGMMRGRMGQIMLASARELVGADVSIEIAVHAPYLPLIGAARMVHNGLSAAVFDFGGTRIKRGIAHYRAGQLVALDVLPSLAAIIPESTAPEQIFDRMAQILAEGSTQTDAAMIPVSIASYVDVNGQPLQAQQGIYMRLGQLHADLPAAFSQAVYEHTGKCCQVRLLHDGTAAAQVYSSQKNSAVIMIGTALGIGFPVERADLCPVAPSLSISGEYAG